QWQGSRKAGGGGRQVAGQQESGRAFHAGCRVCRSGPVREGRGNGAARAETGCGGQRAGRERVGRSAENQAPIVSGGQTVARAKAGGEKELTEAIDGGGKERAGESRRLGARADSGQAL